MADYADRALLPEGFHDVLPPEAAREAGVIGRLMAGFAAYGYERVSPPLMEFEESLLAGSGKTQARAMFRLMDPLTQRMMGVRTDMTIQVARIAATRLAAEPRPLRLSYAGQVLRVRGGQLRSERQFAQAGAELIGEPSLEADLEILALATDALATIGVKGLSLDLTVPTLVPLLADHFDLKKTAVRTLRAALNNKDVAALAPLEGEAARVFKGLLAAAGPADRALVALDKLKLPRQARALIDDVAALVSRLGPVAPGVALTVDPGDFEGFEYKSGISFSLFAGGARGEIGRGGRYQILGADGKNQETAVGVTLYLDSLMRVAPPSDDNRRVYVPHGVGFDMVRRLQKDGWRTVRGLGPEPDAAAAAQRQGCSHLLVGDKVQPV